MYLTVTGRCIKNPGMVHENQTKVLEIPGTRQFKTSEKNGIAVI